MCRPNQAITATLTVLCLVACPNAGLAAPPEDAAFPRATPESQGLSAAALRELADVVRGYVDEDQIVGAELLVIKNRHTVLHEACGWKDRARHVPMACDTIFNIRSMTKPVTGTAAQILIDAGALGLDDPVHRYLPAFDNDKCRTMTVRHVLTHRSGLPLTLLAGTLDGYESLEQIAALGAEKGPEFTPGSAFMYSDAGSEVLGAVVAKAAGQPLDTFVQGRLLDPLGMRDALTLVKVSDPRTSRIGCAYGGLPGDWSEYWCPGQPPIYRFALGSQSLYCTPADYARFLALWLDGGRIGRQQLLSPEAIKRGLTPVSDMEYPTGFAGLKVHYGQMWMLWLPADGPADAKPVVIGHGGSDGTHAWAWPQHDLMILYFTQSRGNATGINVEREIDRLLMHPDTGEAQKAAADEFAPYVGPYHTDFNTQRNQEAAILVQDGQLALRLPQGLVITLLPPDDEGIWRFGLRPTSGVSFDRDENGRVTTLWLHEAIPLRREDEAATTQAADVPAELRAYVGKYVLRAQLIKTLEFAIVADGDKLALRDPDNVLLRLQPPDARGRWYLVDAPREYIAFDRNDDGRITGLTLHQAHRAVPGSLPPEAVLTEAEAAKFVGTYHDPGEDIDTEILFRDGHLAVKSPRFPAPFDLHAPDPQGRWFLRIAPQVALRFNTDDEGRIVSYTVLAPTGEVVRPRVGGPSASQPASAPAEAP